MLKEAKENREYTLEVLLMTIMASDFSTPQFHAINDVCLHYVWFANTIVAKYYSLVIKITRMIYICTTKLFCGLHLNNHIFINV